MSDLDNHMVLPQPATTIPELRLKLETLNSRAKTLADAIQSAEGIEAMVDRVNLTYTVVSGYIVQLCAALTDTERRIDETTAEMTRLLAKNGLYPE
jgi:hypothetical protein